MKTYQLCVLICFVASFSIHSTACGQSTIKRVGEFGNVELIQGGFQFTEGPAATPDGSVYFTDIPAESIFRLTPAGKVELFLKPSLHANGLMYGGDGNLLACQMDGQLAAINLKSKETQVLSSEYSGKRFNACNDLVIDRSGGIYFTDPRYRAPEPWPQGKEAFYYRSKAGKVSRLGDSLIAPNGIALSPDENKLYVVPSMDSKTMVYEIVEPGKLGEGRVLCSLKQKPGESDKGGDGLAVDVDGNLYITTGLGIQVVSPEGELLGIIQVPEHPANCAFGGPDHKTLFITARNGFYRCSSPIEGLVHRKN